MDAKAKKSRANKYAGQDKHTKFLRLGLARTQSAIKRIQLIGNLASSGYESTEKERAQIIAALNDAVADVKSKLEKQTKTKPAFAFDAELMLK